MRILNSTIRAKMEARDDEWVKKAGELADALPKRSGKFIEKKSQLHNLQAMAERSESWKAFELFLNYQGARGELDSVWVKAATASLGLLRGSAESLLASEKKTEDQVRSLHMELVSRVLGFTVRWHIWKLGEEKPHENLRPV